MKLNEEQKKVIHSALECYKEHCRFQEQSFRRFNDDKTANAHEKSLNDTKALLAYFEEDQIKEAQDKAAENVLIFKIPSEAA